MGGPRLPNLRLILLVLSLFIMRSGLSQGPPATGDVKLYRYGELLQKHGIELTNSGLLRALRDPDSSVRYLAAMKLAEDKVSDAARPIEEALAIEKVPRTRVNLALALALLGSQTGNIELRRLCADKNFPPDFRLYAVGYMFDLHVEKDEDCLSAAEELAKPKAAGIGDRVSALNLLGRFRDLTPEESKHAQTVIALGLEDPEPVIRMAAGQAIAIIGDASAIVLLRSAITDEHDDAVRSALDKNLKKLEQRVWK